MGDVVEVADDQEATGARVNDVVDALPQRATRGDYVEGSE
jgi:hypothetical protein